MISDLDGSLGSRYFINVENERTCFASFASAFTAPFSNMQTLKFKAQPTPAFFATVNQTSDSSSQIPTTAEHCSVFVSLSELCSTI